MMIVTVEIVKKWPFSQCIVRVNGEIDSIHYEAAIAYKRADYLRKSEI